MSAATGRTPPAGPPAPPAGPTRPPLRHATLPGWAVPAVGGLALAVSLLLLAVTELSGVAGFLVVAVLVYLAALGGLSAVVEGRRRAVDRLAAGVVTAAFVLALTPLLSVIVTVVGKGVARLDPSFFHYSLRNIGPRDAGGGAYHAIVGTLEQVGLAVLFSVPLGLAAAIYVVEYGRGRLATAIRFFVDVMTGIPSIVAGLFILSFWVIGLGQGFSGFAAALALTILMLPIVIRSSEEMLRLVPEPLREGAYALGITQWRTILRIVLPTALPGLTTGVMLGVARITGETAPVLLTALGNPAINFGPLNGPQSSLSLFVFDQAGRSVQTAIDRAWTAALTLIAIVLILNLVARLLIRRSRIAR